MNIHSFEKLVDAVVMNNRWHKNCKSVRKRKGKICETCPFRDIIEDFEKKAVERKR